MEIKNGIVILDEANGISHFVSSSVRNTEYMSYFEHSGTQIMIPIKTLLRLYSILQYEIERQDTNFEDYCNSFFKDNV